MFGEHAAFILPAYIITFLALALTTLVIWRTHVIRKAELDQMTENIEQAKE